MWASLNQRITCVLLAALLSACGGEPPSAADGDAAQADAARDASAIPADATSSPLLSPEQAQEFDRRRERIDASNQTTEWLPSLTAADPEALAETLERAAEALATGNIDAQEPGALTLYLSVLQTDAANADAREGLAAVAARLFERGRSALADDRFDDAVRLMPVLNRIAGGTPELAAFEAEVDRGREIALLLVEAQRHEAAGRSQSPEGRDAAAAYREILQIDARHALAMTGLGRIEAELVARATAAAEAGDYSAADRLLAQAAKVQPGSGMVQDASTRIVALRQDRAAELLRDAHAAAKAGELQRAEQRLAELERVSAQAQGIEELRLAIEHARLYGGFRPLQIFSDAMSRGGRGPEISVIPAGSFQMGSPRDEAGRKRSEGPRHEVVFARGFGLSRAEISVAQYRSFVEATGYATYAQQTGRSTVYDEKSGSMVERRGVHWQHDHLGEKAAGNLPVVHVAWSDAVAFADWLTRETGRDYRLPTEAEFEYVLRDGSDTRFPWGDAMPSRVVGNLTGDGDRSATKRSWSNAYPGYADGHWGAAPVRNFPPNRLGVHDMVGNVSEWVEDCWHDSYQRAPADGSAWVNPGCNRRVVRGASWASSPEQSRSAHRIKTEPGTSNPRLGFRVARDL